MATADPKTFDEMKMGTLIRMFAGQPADKHTLEVGLADIRTWHADQQEIMRLNNELREALLAIKALCAGDRAPNWIEDGYRVTVTRGQIMDIVDGVVR